MTDFPYEPQRFLARFSLDSWASASAISPSVPASSRPPATGAIFTPMWAPSPAARGGGLKPCRVNCLNFQPWPPHCAADR